MKELFSPPRDSIELSFLKSILDAEEITYHVRNEQFGFMLVSPDTACATAEP